MLKKLTMVLVLMLSAATACHAQIVALGASSTAGYGVGAASSFPSQLETDSACKGPADVG
jgi:acyl-CoA thioesterase-1